MTTRLNVVACCCRICSARCVMRRRLADLEVERDAALRALDQLPWGVVFVDEHRNRLAANRHAEEILIAGDGLTARGNILRADLADETARLERLLNSALDRTGRQRSGAGGTLSITRPSGAHPLSLAVVPLNIEMETLGERGRIAAIFVTDPDSPARQRRATPARTVRSHRRRGAPDFLAAAGQVGGAGGGGDGYYGQYRAHAPEAHLQ